MSNHNHDESGNIVKLTTKDLIKRYFLKRKKYKNKLFIEPNPLNTPPPKAKINHLAIVLDGEVQEIMRAQNRLAALLISEPLFIEFDPKEITPKIGWKYLDGKFYSGE